MIQKNISLIPHNNFKIGGTADYFFEFNTKEELVDGLKEWDKMKILDNIYVLGGGTNILFSDGGFHGLILKDKISFIEKEDGVVEVGTGVLMEELVNFCIENSLAGLEWAGGLPGTVGGAVRGNAGAFGGETKDHVVEARSMDIKTFNEKTRNNEQCVFGYRESTFKDGEGKSEIILSAKFRVWPGDKEKISAETQEKVEYRAARHPLDFPNAGSVFKNIPWEEVPDEFKPDFEQYIKKDPFPVFPVAKLLSIAGLKGKEFGGAMVSEKHPNFIINFKNAKASDVKGLIALVKKEIMEKYRISLEEEIIVM